jgi:LysM repeat protein
MQRRILMAIAAICAMMIAGSVSAQDAGNLLRDPGFEGEYTSRGSADFNIPADWSAWFATAPRTEAWMNLQPVAFPHNGPGPNPQSGARAINMNKGFATFTAAVYQQVTVPSNANLIGLAFSYLKTCNLAPGFDNCASAVESGAFTRVGIDPTGGTDPNSPNIIWSGNAQPHDRWEQMTVNATARGTTVTLFLYVTQRWPSDLNNVYFDSASLSAGGAGGTGSAAADAGAPPPAPVPQTVPFVVAQGEQEDGSIVHTVQPGDTVDSIAVAYGVTRRDILSLNNITDARIIVIGQQLIIRPPTTTAQEAEQPETSEQAPEPTPTAPQAAAEAASQDDAAPQAEAAAPTPRPFDVAALPAAPVRSASNGDVQPVIDPAAAGGQVCVLMFEDTVQNRLPDSDEGLLTGGSIILIKGTAQVADYTTDGSEPHCFERLEAGDYVASVAPPDGYGLTTPDQLGLRVSDGSSITVAFGAARDAVAPAPPSADGPPLLSEPSTDESAAPAANPLVDNLGIIALGAAAVALLGGLGVTFILRRR